MVKSEALGLIPGGCRFFTVLSKYSQAFPHVHLGAMFVCLLNCVCSSIIGYGYPAAGVVMGAAAAVARQPTQPEMSYKLPPHGQPQGYQHPGGPAASSGPASPVNYVLSVRHPYVHMGYTHICMYQIK